MKSDMPIYKDVVDASMQKVRAVLQEHGMLDGFTSSVKDQKTAAASEEIVNFIVLQLEQYLMANASETIDQISGRIQAKLDDLGESGVSVSDEAIEKIKDALSQDQSDGVNDILQKILEILNSAGSKIQKFKEFITEGKTEDETANQEKQEETALPDKELFIKFIDEVMLDVMFFDDRLQRLQKYLDVRCGLLQNMGFEVAASALAVAAANMSLAAANASLAVSNFQLALSNMSMSLANITLSAANFAMSAAKLLLSASNIVLAMARVSLMVAVITFFVGVFTAILSSTAVFIVGLLASSAAAVSAVFASSLTVTTALAAFIAVVFTMSIAVMAAVFAAAASVTAAVFAAAASVMAMVFSTAAAVSAALFSATAAVVTAAAGVVISLFTAALSVAVSLVMAALSIAVSLMTATAGVLVSMMIASASLLFTAASVAMMVAIVVGGAVAAAIAAAAFVGAAIIAGGALVAAAVLASSVFIGAAAAVLAVAILAGALVVALAAVAVIAVSGALLIAAGVVAVAIALALAGVGVAIVLATSALGAALIVAAGVVFTVILAVALALISVVVAAATLVISLAIAAFTAGLTLLLVLVVAVPLGIVWGIWWVFQQIKKHMGKVDETSEQVDKWMDFFRKPEDKKTKSAGFMAWLGDILTGWFKGVTDWVSNWAVWRWLGDAWNWIKNLPAKVGNAISSFVKEVKDGFIDWWNGFVDAIVEAGKLHIDLWVKTFDLDLFSWLEGIKITKEAVVAPTPENTTEIKENVVLPDESPEEIVKIMQQRDDDVVEKVQEYANDRRRDENEAEAEKKKKIDAATDSIIQEINKDDPEGEVLTPPVPVQAPGARKSLEEQEK